MDKEKFKEIILDILNKLPPEFKNKIKNLGIVVEDECGDPAVTIKKRGYTLGLYQGLPSIKKPGKIYNLPDKITIYKKTIEKISNNDNDLEKNIRKVVLHELGHYFGLDDKRLRELGY